MWVDLPSFLVCVPICNTAGNPNLVSSLSPVLRLDIVVGGAGDSKNDNGKLSGGEVSPVFIPYSIA